MTQQRIQDFYPSMANQCFGCGIHNDNGMQVSTYMEGDEAVTTWQPKPHLQGAANIMHGGITASLIDEVAAAAAFVQAHRNRGLKLGDLAVIDFFTASMSVDYLKPIPMDRPVHLRARITESTERKFKVACSVLSGDVEAARGDLLFIVRVDKAGTGLKNNC